MGDGIGEWILKSAVGLAYGIETENLLEDGEQVTHTTSVRLCGRQFDRLWVMGKMLAQLTPWMNEDAVRTKFKQRDVSCTIAVSPGVGPVSLTPVGESGHHAEHGIDLRLSFVVLTPDLREKRHAVGHSHLGGDPELKTEMVGDRFGVKAGAGGVENRHSPLMAVAEELSAKFRVDPTVHTFCSEISGVLL